MLLKGWRLLITAATVFLLLFLFPVNILAKSGCCSSHGGVNCSAGSQSNGHVICYDGWLGSSCLYSEMVMCGGMTTSTTTVVATPQPTVVKTVTSTVKPTATAMIKATTTPTISPRIELTDTPISTPEPTDIQDSEVMGASDNPTPTSSPAPLTTGGTIGVLAFLAFIIWLPIWIIKKIIKRFKDKKEGNKDL